ncbi:glucose 1-dehydrogenase [Shimazuella sp. AN120528]|uniref:SDR family NAD(P)-dependent oxidoreductase n=1 Tax=Shimazuella soli TaxID=1892854 RepID=UPI001F117072|nr:glucose 1-dehydrogenase [Shimazuella soli]MCH5584910.1 glucose 1-dehydrogenase [Shimazuella soli]
MYLPSFDLTGQIAVVTGAGRGIGRALAIGLAEAGADVAIFARTMADLEKVKQEIEQIGRKSWLFAVDIQKKEEVENAIQELITQTGKIDILVNNAGLNIRKPALEVTDEEWDTILNINLKSAFMMSKAVANSMKEARRGVIINITSVAGHVALRTGVPYGASKAGLVQMTKTLALEWAKYGIRVNAVGPWYFKTELTNKLLNNPNYLDEILAHTPMKRIGELQDLVGPVVFLASDAASYVTGQTLFVDGGMTIYGF